MITRHKKYLREIIVSYFGATYDELLKIEEVSGKTFKSDILAIQNELSKYDLKIIEDKDRYYIPFEQKEEFLNAYEDIIHKDETQVLANEYKERKMYILTYLCRSDDYFSMNILADKLYVSKSSISPIIHELKDEIERLVPSASLDVSGRKGIKLNAKEKDRREILVRSFVVDGSPLSENSYFLNYLEDDLKDKLSETMDVISTFLNEKDIMVSDKNFSKIVAHVLITAQRNRHDRFLNENDLNENDFYNELSIKLKTIGLDIKKEELSSLPLNNINRSIIKNDVAVKIVYEFIDDINKKFHYEVLRKDDAGPLIAHIDEILNQSFKPTEYQEFVFDTMLKRLLSAYIMCNKLCDLLAKYADLKVDEENRAYMAMHVQDMIRKHLVIKEKMLLYDANISECNMIKTDLEKHFGSKAVITPLYTRWDIEKKLKENNYSIILSTKSVLGLFDEVPFLKINSFLNNSDYDAINMIVYKNRPVKIIQGGSLKDNCFIYNDIKTNIDQEILLIDDLYITCTINPKLNLGVYKTEYKKKKMFILNDDLKDDFIVYHRLINRFGQMIKEKKL